jgi:thiol:disulfide interchange protein
MKPIVLLFSLAAPLLAQSTVQWEHELPAAQKRARSEKKLLFVDVWAEWCGPCQYLKNKVFPTPEAQKALGKFIPVSLMTQSKDGKSDPGNMKVAEGYRVEAYPTLLLLDAEGKEVRRHVGAFRTGAEFAAWLEK